MARIVVLGSANLDLVVRQPRLAEVGETIFGSGFSTVPGGKGLNQAIAAARAGAEVVFIGAVGRDAFAAPLRAALVAEGIDVSLLVEADAPTGVANVHVLDSGENAIVVVPGANLVSESLTEQERATILSADALLTQFERPVPLVLEALKAARRAGVRTVLTPAPVQEVPPQLLDFVDLLVLNGVEARGLAGLPDELDAVRELSRRSGTVIMTRGSQGQVIAREGRVVEEHPAHPAEAVDTTAAGDTFVGVLTARAGLGDGFQVALRAATVAAAISVTRLGASTSMPAWDEVAPLL